MVQKNVLFQYGGYCMYRQFHFVHADPQGLKSLSSSSKSKHLMQYNHIL